MSGRNSDGGEACKNVAPAVGCMYVWGVYNQYKVP